MGLVWVWDGLGLRWVGFDYPLRTHSYRTEKIYERGKIKRPLREERAAVRVASLLKRVSLQLPATHLGRTPDRSVTRSL